MPVCAWAESINARMHTHTHTHTHVDIHTWTYTRTCVSACMFVGMQLCFRAGHCICLLLCAHTSHAGLTRARLCVCVCVCVRASMSGCVPVLVWQAWKWQGLRSGETLCKCPPTTLAENARARRHPFCPTLNPKPQSPQASLLSCARMRVWTSWCAWTCSCVRTGIGPCPMCVCLCVCVCVNVL